MASWYYKVSGDISLVADCIDFYEKELDDARDELDMSGLKLERVGAKLPGLVELRFNQLQEIEAILEFLNIELKRVKTDKYKHYLMHYNKTLSSRDADKFADGDVDVINMAVLVNEFALVRNKFLGITKGLDQISWMVGHITRLRCAGLDDAML